MATGYKIGSNDIDTVFETFTTSQQSTYNIPDSKFTDGTNKFKKNNQALKTAISKTFPTSAGSYFGGYNTTSEYKILGNQIDVALKGCRPIGIELRTLNSAGTYTIYRNGSNTYLVNGHTTSGGSLLASGYSPRYMFFELQGGGGGGGSSSLSAGGQGGGGGAYIFCAVCCDNPIYLTVGAGGSGGSVGNSGNHGSPTILTVTYNGITYTFTATGGDYGAQATGDNGQDVSPTINPSSISTEYVRYIAGSIGKYGGGKDTKGGSLDAFTCTFYTPENRSFSRGGTEGGYTDYWGYGGGGGACAFHDGADPIYRNSAVGVDGAGGTGGGYQPAKRHGGGNGGTGLIKIYY